MDAVLAPAPNLAAPDADTQLLNAAAGGAIPFAAADPLHVIPGIMLGSAVTTMPTTGVG